MLHKQNYVVLLIGIFSEILSSIARHGPIGPTFYSEDSSILRCRAKVGFVFPCESVARHRPGRSLERKQCGLSQKKPARRSYFLTKVPVI